jgi:DNA-binding NarL/FixJ family response regulator
MRKIDDLSIILFDQHRESRQLVRDMLITTGVMDVRESNAIDDLLDKLRVKKADLVLMELPDDSKAGIEIVLAIRNPAKSPAPKVAITVITGLTDKKRVLAMRDAGVNDFIAKPVSADALHKRLARLVDKPQEFVENKAYFGPDRRRRDIDPAKDRRQGD